jgi:hypothetical protein
MRISNFLLVLFFGFSALMSIGLGHLYAQEFPDCDRQTFSLVDCPEPSTSESNSNYNDSKNFEEQIPLVIPFS